MRNQLLQCLEGDAKKFGYDRVLYSAADIIRKINSIPIFNTVKEYLEKNVEVHNLDENVYKSISDAVEDILTCERERMELFMKWAVSQGWWWDNIDNVWRDDHIATDKTTSELWKIAESEGVFN